MQDQNRLLLSLNLGVHGVQSGPLVFLYFCGMDVWEGAVFAQSWSSWYSGLWTLA
jgi:hypothetical protein